MALGGVGALPVPGDVDPARKPDAVMRQSVVKEAPQPRDLARAPDQAAVQADREHLGLPRCAFGIKRVEAVLEVLKERLTRAVAGRGGKAHVVGL